MDLVEGVALSMLGFLKFLVTCVRAFFICFAAADRRITDYYGDQWTRDYFEHIENGGDPKGKRY
jgi:hypothetical protein